MPSPYERQTFFGDNLIFQGMVGWTFYVVKNSFFFYRTCNIEGIFHINNDFVVLLYNFFGVTRMSNSKNHASFHRDFINAMSFQFRNVIPGLARNLSQKKKIRERYRV